MALLAPPSAGRGRVAELVALLKEGRFVSKRTARSVRFDLLRLRARLRHQLGRAGTAPAPASPRLHVGCGKRAVAGWLNVDVAGSEFDVDLACGSLPWAAGAFEAIVAQQVIEHLDLDTELRPLLAELRRVLGPGGEIWASTPDLEKVCESYREDRGRALEADRKTRWPDFSLAGKPPQQMLNVLFHQGGEHQNLFDYDLVKWLFDEAGFVSCERTSEEEFLRRFPEFPRRNDGPSSVYVRARAP